ncbi:Gfo/Idh/MocA family oxidoreductase [Devosia sp. FKR38]|uniref:Gfo/Idh/MocA family protein n=1 Tax=Devosia sp. FKR38 TaxID=2562312 RepID=UPI0010C00707|nr:Gfo/Idh/MocA family oxidoreductase [Devosia sp. FKR38]
MTQRGQLSVLIIGCGNIAGGFDVGRPADALPLSHAGAYRRDGRFRVTTCVETDPARRSAFMDHWQVPEGYASTHALQGRTGQFDVISICSPTSAHADDLEAAIALRPRAIFCEKPMTPSLAASEHAVAQCNAAGIVLAINHSRRWAPDVWRLRAELQSGSWGLVRSAAARYTKGVLNNGGHMLDLLEFLLGPLTVQWAGVPVSDFWPDDPTIPAALVSAAGVPVLLAVGDARDYATFELTLTTEMGLITMEDGGNQWRYRRVIDSPTFAGYKALDAGAQVTGEYQLAMLNAVADIYDAATTGSPVRSTGVSALAAQRHCAEIRARAAQPAEEENDE